MSDFLRTCLPHTENLIEQISKVARHFRGTVYYYWDLIAYSMLRSNSLHSDTEYWTQKAQKWGKEMTHLNKKKKHQKHSTLKEAL